MTVKIVRIVDESKRHFKSQPCMNAALAHRTAGERASSEYKAIRHQASCSEHRRRLDQRCSYIVVVFNA